MPYYAVAKGRSAGVYNSWGDCENQVKGYSGATFKKFDTAQEAQSFVRSHGGGGDGGSSSSSISSSSSYGGSYSGGYSSSSSYRGNRGFEKDYEGYTQVYTDGSCPSNGQQGARAGVGVYWGDDHPLNTSEPVRGRTTNNTGEIQAATRAMKQALDNGVKKLAINTDSKFLINSATKWMPGWKNNGWKVQSGDPVKNQEDFKELDRLQSKLDVKWNYVESHKGNHGNEMADRLAKAGANKSNY